MWGYKYNVANMTTFPIDGFWELSTEAGKYFVLLPFAIPRLYSGMRAEISRLKKVSRWGARLSKVLQTTFRIQPGDSSR